MRVAFDLYAEVGQTLYKYNGEKIITVAVSSISIEIGDYGTTLYYNVTRVGRLDDKDISNYGRSKEEAFRLAMTKLSEAFKD